MNLLKELTKKNLILNKKRTIVTIIGIILSVALITAVSSMYASGIKSLTTYEKDAFGNYHVKFNNVKKDDISYIKNNRMISSVSYLSEIGYAKIDSKNEYKPYAYVLAFTNDSLKDLNIHLKEGRLPTNDSEIVIPEHLRTNGKVDYKIDDELQLDIGKRFLDNEALDPFNLYDEREVLKDIKHKKYKVVGIIKRPNTTIEAYENPGYSFITYLDENSNYDYVNIYARYTKAGLKKYTKVTSDIINVKEETIKTLYTLNNGYNEEKYNEAQNDLSNAKYMIEVNASLIDLEKNPLKTNTYGNLTNVVLIVCLIIVFTSVFCIKNSFDISITEKIRQYGMLRSIGATKKQIRKNVFYEATILGVIGIPLGILLGFLATIILILISNSLINTLAAEQLKLQFAFSLISVVFSILLGIITIYLSALRSAFKAAKVSAIESIRNSNDIKIRGKKIKSPKFINKIFGIGGEISYKNLKRNKKKYRTTTLSLIVSVITFISLSYFMSLLKESINDEIKQIDYNLSVACTHSSSKECDKKLLKTISFDNVDKYTILRGQSIDLKEHRVNKEVEEKYNEDYDYYDEKLNKNVKKSYYDNIRIIAVGDLEYNNLLKKLNLDYDDVYNKAILVDTFILSEYTTTSKKKTKYKIYDYKENDKIKYSFTDDNDLEHNGSIEIVKTTDIISFGLKSTLLDNLGSFIVISDKYYDELFKSDEIDTMYYKSSNANKLESDIEKYLGEYEKYVNNTDKRVREYNSLILLIGIFLYGFITVIILIGITNIFNTITTGIYLRKREFAMLKSVGMTSNEFNKMISLESIFMGIKSLLYSIPISLILTLIIYKRLGVDMGLNYNIPYVSIIISIISIFALISIIMKYSVSKVSKQNIIETIRNENI